MLRNECCDEKLLAGINPKGCEDEKMTMKMKVGMCAVAIVAAILCPRVSFADKPADCPEGYIWLETSDSDSGASDRHGFDPVR